MTGAILNRIRSIGYSVKEFQRRRRVSRRAAGWISAASRPVQRR